MNDHDPTTTTAEPGVSDDSHPLVNETDAPRRRLRGAVPSLLNRLRPGTSGRGLRGGGRRTGLSDRVAAAVARLEVEPWRLWPTSLLPVWACLAAAASFALLLTVHLRSLPSDVGVHITFVLTSAQTGEWLPNWLFYRVVHVLSTGSGEYNVVLFMTMCVLAASVAAKYLVSVAIARRWLRPELASLPAEHRARFDALLIFTIFLSLFAFSLPVNKFREYYYIGQFPANVWHNSTTIFLMPFALGLLWAGWRYLRAPRRSLLLWIVALSLLNLLAKPSFFLTFAVAFPIMVLATHRLRRPTWEAAAAFLIPVAYLWMQTNALYIEQDNAGAMGGLAWTPFLVWRAFSDNLVLSVAASVLFPASVLAAYPGIALRSMLYRFVLLNFAVGLTVYSLLSEKGPRQFDANLSWQVIVTMFMLFLVSILVMFRGWARNGRVRIEDWLVAIAFGLHLVSGVVYIARWFIIQQYV